MVRVVRRRRVAPRAGGIGARVTALAPRRGTLGVTWERLGREIGEQPGHDDRRADQDAIDDAQAAQTGVTLR
jgi:hypothetical protein